MESVGNIDTKRKPGKIRLKKELGFYELLVIGVAGALGNGALFGTVQMVSGAGPGAIFGFVFGAIIYGLITMTYVEMSKVYPEAGGPTRYTMYTHGRWTNLIIALPISSRCLVSSARSGITLVAPKSYITRGIIPSMETALYGSTP